MMLMYGAGIKLVSDCVFTTLTPNTFSLALGMGFLAMFGMGLSLVALIVSVQLAADSDEHIGLATLILGSVRAIGGSTAVTIFTSIINNSIKKDIGPRVGKAIVPLGVAVADVGKVIAAIQGNPKHPEKALAIAGMTVPALQAAGQAFQWTYAIAFQRIYYAALACSALALTASFFVKDISHNMTNEVAVTLKNEEGQKKVNPA
jgi:hypothetical protein